MKENPKWQKKNKKRKKQRLLQSKKWEMVLSYYSLKSHNLSNSLCASWIPSSFAAARIQGFVSRIPSSFAAARKRSILKTQSEEREQKRINTHQWCSTIWILLSFSQAVLYIQNKSAFTFHNWFWWSKKKTRDIPQILISERWRIQLLLLSPIVANKPRKGRNYNWFWFI